MELVIRRLLRISAGTLAVIVFCQANRNANLDAMQALENEELTLPDKLDGKMSMRFLKQMCELGPRISGSAAMEQQQQLLQNHFEKLGGRVERQSWMVKHPVNRTDVELTNMIVYWHPQRRERVLICCHYDTRPFPDKDPINRHGLFLGANDGASCVGLLCELGQYMPQLNGNLGVDFVFFDAEEFVYDSVRDPLFLGSTHFARDYAKNPPPYSYSRGVLIDMIGDKDLNIYFEKNSLKRANKITKQIWKVAEREGVKEFIPRPRHTIRDDHLPLNDIARIPTTDIIDFDYPNPSSQVSYWHTQQDTPDKCSAESMAKVGNVLLSWLKEIGGEN